MEFDDWQSVWQFDFQGEFNDGVKGDVLRWQAGSDGTNRTSR